MQRWFFCPAAETCGDWFNLPRAIDYFILAELEKRQLKPIGPATRPDLLRRATFGLTGLPPTPEEMDDGRSAVSSRCGQAVA